MKPQLPPAIVLPKLPPIQREFVFTDDDFDRIRRFIHQRAGIALNPSKKDRAFHCNLFNFYRAKATAKNRKGFPLQSLLRKSRFYKKVTSTLPELW